jgi:N6-adenosine-specific RNA methylase IME4
MLDAITVRNGGDTLQLGAFTLGKTGLIVAGQPTLSEWEGCGRVLARIEGAVQFWIGDWVNYGAHTYHEKYDEVVDALGFDRQTVKNYAYVAQNIPSSRRRDDVLFSVHSEVAPLPLDKQAEILARAAAEDLTVRAVRDIVRSTNHAGKVAAILKGDLCAGVYDIVCADPPWTYDNAGFDQSAANHYPTMSVDDLCTLPQRDPTFPACADPCVCFLWATSPLLPSALVVLEQWGFDYKACMAWVKDRAPGLGWWLHTRHELLLIGSRGTVTPLEKVDSVITAAVAEHSRKPGEAYAAIDRMFPGLRRVEVFARQPRPGWDVWGNEV